MTADGRVGDVSARASSYVAQNGLKRGENGLQLHVMCEIPSDVILAKAFAERFDGFSIGSDVTLGVGRDAGTLQVCSTNRTRWSNG